MAARKSRKKPARTAKQPQVQESAQESTAINARLMQEVALADVRFGFGFSGFYNQIKYNPDDLIGRKGLKIYTTMRRDEQIKAALYTKKLATVASGVEIVIEDKSRAEDSVLEEQKRFIEFNLNEMEGTISSYLMEALTALDYGFSITEPTYKAIDYGEFEGKIGWKALKVRHPEQFEFETDQYGNLTEDGILQGQQRIDADRLAIFSYRKEFSNLYGQSDLRECHRAWFVKDTLVKFMAMCMERYGMPIPVATTTTSLSDDVKLQLLQIMKNIQSRTGIIIPSTIELKFENPGQGAQAAFPPIFKQLDQWIAMAILMPSLIGAGGGAESVGSNARAETEQDTFFWIVEQLRNELQEFVNDKIIKVLIDYNYVVTDGIYPKLKFNELTHERKIAILDKMQTLITGNVLTKTAEDEEFARNLLGVPELPEDEISAGTREAKEREQQDQIDMAGKMARAVPAVSRMPSRGEVKTKFENSAEIYHLPDDHDQITHGNWAHGGSSEDVGDNQRSSDKKRKPSEQKEVSENIAKTINKWAYSYTGTSAYTKMRKDSKGELAKVLKSMPRFSGTAFRGLGLKQSELDKLKKGSSFSMKLHSSASKERSIASSFALLSAELDARIPVMLEVKTRDSAADISKVVKGDYRDQKEVVLTKGGKFKVASVEPYRFRAYRDKSVKIAAQDGYRVILVET